MTTHIVVLPGGGYAEHAPSEGEPVVRWLESLGIEASVFLYPVGVHHPEPHIAVSDEIARLRAAGIERVGVMGFSAGGHAAGLAALSPVSPASRPDFAVLSYAVVSMVPPTNEGSAINLLGADASLAERRSVSLEMLVSEQSPPIFAWQTADDVAVPVATLYRLGEALAAQNRPHAIHVYPRGPHGLGVSAEGLALWTEECARWLSALDHP
ncbi:alpha/beta hydrolase [Microbacterium saperdae]|uniref:Prolyl oligopeptidase family protein n=1 Tax=Microbacterium saperdae TaxID=69368 RepID=A0A543BIK8_9MICO|nr:prolyl oligopeptidase family serine peptidase [Microbacterium saperdae]TQL84689.1 prolyl oligopeptidase family protein [Microbacterium saperdae]GGM64924.1 hypothetical protein GCM10010489_40610 [Microbacterium saperdae]